MNPQRARRAVLLSLFVVMTAVLLNTFVLRWGELHFLNRAYGGDFAPSGGIAPKGFKPGMGGGSSAGGSHGPATASAPPAASAGASNVIVCDVVSHRCRASHPGGRQEIVKFRFVDRESLR